MILGGLRDKNYKFRCIYVPIEWDIIPVTQHDSDEIRPCHKRQHEVLRVPQGLWTSHEQLHTTKKGDRILDTARIPQAQDQNQNQTPTQQPPPRQTTTQHQQPLGEIHVISGGFAGGGESSSARKAHLRSIRSAEMVEIQAVSKVPRLDSTITFSDLDLEGCQHPHDDPLVIRAIVANTTVHRVLIDNGSSADIIFASAFDKMGIGREKLDPVNTHLRGFSGEKVLPLGSIQLVLTLGEPPCQATTTARFLIVDAPSAYNMLLGRPSLNAIKAIPSAYHMVIKFPTIHGVGMVRGDQRVARECYTASMKQKAVDNVSVDELDMRDEVLT